MEQYIRKYPILFPLLLIIIGVAIWFVFESDILSGPVVLEERTSSLGNKTISILVPKNSEEFIPDPSQPILSYGKGSKEIPMMIVGLYPQPPFPFSLDCKELKKPIIFTANIASINRNIDICEDPLGGGVPPDYRGYKLVGTSGFKYEGSLEEKLYMIQVAVKEDYFNTGEGMEKVKKIFESFTVK